MQTARYDHPNTRMKFGEHLSIKRCQNNDSFCKNCHNVLDLKVRQLKHKLIQDVDIPKTYMKFGENLLKKKILG